MNKIYQLTLVVSILFWTSCNDFSKDSKMVEGTFMDMTHKIDDTTLAAKPMVPIKKLVNIDIEHDKGKVHYGIDISHYQGNLMEEISPHDSLKFIICKASQGIDYVDPDFYKNWSTIKEKGFIRGAYHFYMCDDNPISQAHHFATTINGISKNDIAPILDIEQGGMTKSVDYKQMQIDVLLFLREVTKLTNRTPILYTDYAFAQEYLKDDSFAEYPLWLAEYSKGPTPLVPTIWKKSGCKIWQKSATYTTYSENTDFDVYHGELKMLVK